MSTKKWEKTANMDVFVEILLTVLLKCSKDSRKQLKVNKQGVQRFQAAISLLLLFVFLRLGVFALLNIIVAYCAMP